MKESSKRICKICGHEARLVASEIGGYIEGSFFNIYRCDNCEVNFAENETVNHDVYQLIYSKPEQTPGYNRYYWFAKNIKEERAPLKFLSNQEAMYWAVNKVLSENYRDKKGKMLEVGSGLGYLTFAMSQEGYNITGLDISENAVQDANSRFGQNYIVADIFEYYKENKNSYDFIILTEVIEHLEDPKPFIACLLEMLTAGGRLIITTPNKTVDTTTEHWNTELPPVHLWWFSEKTATILARDLSCSVNFIDFTDYNKRHFDKMRFKIYKSYNFTPTFDIEGKLINPMLWNPAKTGFKTKILQSIATVSSYWPFEKILTRKEYPTNKSSTLAFIMKK